MNHKAFEELTESEEGKPMEGLDITSIQVNVGLLCNMQCRHCHVKAGPERSEQMAWETMEAIMDAARKAQCNAINITGGAPELNPNFRRFITALHEKHFEISVRTNLTVMLESGMEDMPEFLAEKGVALVGSMPCYLKENVDAQRGDGSYEKSVAVLRKLNALGYGMDANLELDLIYNPGGPALPPAQEELEAAYRRKLMERFEISFTRLHTITNMPIGRFWDDLCARQEGEAYKELLRDNFNAATLTQLMCRHQISVDWQGQVHDCDFNLALGLPVEKAAGIDIHDFDNAKMAHRKIVTGEHCFGCTAGCGSSCGGALLEAAWA